MTYIYCMSRSKLSSSDRDFFSALGDVVFRNPFSPQRDELIVRLAPGAKAGDLTNDREARVRVVGPRLAPWLREGMPAVNELCADDRKLLDPAVLSVCYHRYAPQLSAKIERQVPQNC